MSWNMQRTVISRRTFLNEIYANDTEFYETILTEIGAIGAYIPAQSSEAYKEPVEYFSGEPIWANFAEWAKHVPPISVGVYSDEVDSTLVTQMAKCPERFHEYSGYAENSRRPCEITDTVNYDLELEYKL